MSQQFPYAYLIRNQDNSMTLMTGIIVANNMDEAHGKTDRLARKLHPSLRGIECIKIGLPVPECIIDDIEKAKYFTEKP